jgi:hypothetical protein
MVSKFQNLGNLVCQTLKTPARASPDEIGERGEFPEVGEQGEQGRWEKILFRPLIGPLMRASPTD